MMSTSPRLAQVSAIQNKPISTSVMARPIGDAGVSITSSAAGRKASRSIARSSHPSSALTSALADFMESPLQAVQRSVAAPGDDQLLMCSVLNQAPAIQGDDAVA